MPSITIYALARAMDSIALTEDMRAMDRHYTEFAQRRVKEEEARRKKEEERRGRSQRRK